MHTSWQDSEDSCALACSLLPSCDGFIFHYQGEEARVPGGGGEGGDGGGERVGEGGGNQGHEDMVKNMCRLYRNTALKESKEAETYFSLDRHRTRPTSALACLVTSQEAAVSHDPAVPPTEEKPQLGLLRAFAMSAQEETASSKRAKPEESSRSGLCIERGSPYGGFSMPDVDRKEGLEECQALCQLLNSCLFFDFDSGSKRCKLRFGIGDKNNVSRGQVFGPEVCPGPEGSYNWLV